MHTIVKLASSNKEIKTLDTLFEFVPENYSVVLWQTFIFSATEQENTFLYLACTISLNRDRDLPPVVACKASNKDRSTTEAMVCPDVGLTSHAQMQIDSPWKGIRPLTCLFLLTCGADTNGCLVTHQCLPYHTSFKDFDDRNTLGPTLVRLDNWEAMGFSAFDAFNDILTIISFQIASGRGQQKMSFQCTCIRGSVIKEDSDQSGATGG